MVLIVFIIGITGLFFSVSEISALLTGYELIAFIIEITTALIAVSIIFRKKIFYYLNLIMLTIQIIAGFSFIITIAGFGIMSNEIPQSVILFFSFLTVLWLFLFCGLRTKKVKEWVFADSN